MKAIWMKHFCVVLIASCFSMNNGKTVGRVVPRDPPITVKSDAAKVAEVYRESGNGSSWLKILLMFARDSPNIQSQLHTEDAPYSGGCVESTNRREQTSLCKDGFIQLDSKKCYLISAIRRSWQEALAVCESLGSTLAYPMNVLENTVLASYLKTHFNQGLPQWWIGCSDKAKLNEWIWAHNKTPVKYTDWNKGQPDGASGGERCVLIYGELWKWYDGNCLHEAPFVCQQLD